MLTARNWVDVEVTAPLPSGLLLVGYCYEGALLSRRWCPLRLALRGQLQCFEFLSCSMIQFTGYRCLQYQLCHWRLCLLMELGTCPQFGVICMETLGAVPRPSVVVFVDVLLFFIGHRRGLISC